MLPLTLPRPRWSLPAGLALLLALAGGAGAADPPTDATAALAASAQQALAGVPDSAWRPLDDAHTMYLELPRGRIVIELQRALAPHTVANIETLVRQHYFDGLPVARAQDNYVVQWGDEDHHPIPSALRSLAPEFAVPLEAKRLDVLPDRDGYAAQVGFVDSFPTARDPANGLAWLTHCYGAVGVGRDVDPSTGNGSELYAVIGQSPRQLDRNVTVVGIVRQGMELLSTLPRGTGPLGFYQTPAEQTPIRSVRMADELPVAQRSHLQVLRSDTPAFAAWVESRRNRHDAWYQRAAGHIDLCNVPIPVRAAAP